ncbi:MAG: hypothetical protein HY000_03480 [Planctomycetes bacterium]|nr:hypothetical protein [Planctomycetota bacterium]
MCFCGPAYSQGQAPPAAAAPAAVPDQATLDKQFEETLSGSVLEGSFTVTGREDRIPKSEKYTIEKVSKLQNDYWLFQARIQYGDRDVTLPLPLQVKWAGDTPVITLTDLMIPGLGTYTARVVIYRDQYAGTWSASDHGGHLFGRVVKTPAEEKAKQ